jgi:hypothetical protein
VIEQETKRTGDMINSRKLFDDSEAVHPILEEEKIKIEKDSWKTIVDWC